MQINYVIKICNKDIDKLKNISTNLKNLKNKVHKLDVNNLVPVSVDLNKVKQ